MKRTFAAATLIAAGGLAGAASAATVTPIASFDPGTYFSGGVTAGIDFDDGGPTQSGFLSIPASNSKTYNVTTGGITFDLVVSGTNAGNQNRDRGASGGDLVRDFEQWYNNTGSAVEGKLTLTGLKANTDYDISFFMFNIGAGQTTQSFYDGGSSASPLITTFTTSGNQNNFATWSPGVTLGINSGAASTITVTVQQTTGRLTLNGIAVNEIPEPGSLALIGIGGLLIARRRRA